MSVELPARSHQVWALELRWYSELGLVSQSKPPAASACVLVQGNPLQLGMR
jgi:hypothetical protein